MKTPEQVTPPTHRSPEGPPKDAQARPGARLGGGSGGGRLSRTADPLISQGKWGPRVGRDLLGSPSSCLGPFLSFSEGLEPLQQEARLRRALGPRGCKGLTAWAGSYLGAWLALGAQGGSGDALGPVPFEPLAQPLAVVNDYPAACQYESQVWFEGHGTLDCAQAGWGASRQHQAGPPSVPSGGIRPWPAFLHSPSPSVGLWPQVTMGSQDTQDPPGQNFRSVHLVPRCKGGSKDTEGMGGGLCSPERSADDPSR